jgi:hypothetical protein
MRLVSDTTGGEQTMGGVEGISYSSSFGGGEGGKAMFSAEI